MRRSLLAVLGLTTIAGCTGVSIFDLLGGLNVPPETGSSKLLPFSSEKELVDYFADQVTAQNSRSAGTGPFLQFGDDVAMLGGSEPDNSPRPSPPSAAPEGSDQTSSNDFSQTTIQEQGVDESDVVKTDGDYLYLMDEGSLKIVSIADRSQMQVVSTTPLEGYGQDLFLHDGKVVALTSKFGGFFPVPLVEPLPAPGDPEPRIAEDLVFERPSTTVTIVDVSTPQTPTVLSTTSFEGTHSASRMIDGVLHFVVANFQNDYVNILPIFETESGSVAGVAASVVLPSFERTDADGTKSSGEVVSWREVYRPTDPDGYGVVTVISLDVDADAAFTGVGVVAAPGLIYSSLNALYLTDTEFNFSLEIRETTDIYKFAYVDRGAVPSATGSVPGRVLNQYSMSEHNGFLRVATTVSGSFAPFGVRQGPFNNVYVLSETGDGLSVAGSVENIAPGETIRSARFVGDRGYLVTFEQIDPFFTLDLSDPTQPKVVGELKIPGFSTFLIPMDETHLLAVGQYVPEDGALFFSQGVQLSIFDVSDFSNPVRSANVVLGEDAFAYSDALFNPKAFTYFKERGLVALPITIEDRGPFFDVVFVDVDEPMMDGNGDVPSDDTLIIDPVPPERFEGLIVFSASVDSGLIELGRIDTRPVDTDFFGSAFTRGIFVGDDVLAVTDRVIRGAPISSLDTVSYEVSMD